MRKWQLQQQQQQQQQWDWEMENGKGNSIANELNKSHLLTFISRS